MIAEHLDKLCGDVETPRFIDRNKLDPPSVFDRLRMLVCAMGRDFSVVGDAKATEILAVQELLDQPGLVLGRMAVIDLHVTSERPRVR